MTVTENDGAQEARNDETENQDQDSRKLSYEELEAELAKTRREAAGRRVLTREQQAKLDEYEEWKKNQLSELERAKLEAKEALERAAAAERESLQVKAAKKAGLDIELADRIRGNSLDEMIEDAKQLAERAPKNTGTQLFGGSNGRPLGTKSKTPDSWVNDFLRGKRTR